MPEDTAFRVLERKFKIRNGVVPSLEGVLGRRKVGNVEYYPVNDDGAYYLPNFLGEEEQVGLVKDALCVYPDESEGHDCNLLHDGKGVKRKRGDEQGVLHDKGLRWVTVGYAYDWSEKTYDKEKKSRFPEKLKKLADEKYRPLKEALSLPQVNFQTAIINFYNEKSTLMAHTDTYESPAALPLPLLTLSLCRSAVFLLGGTTKSTPPTPLLLESGDAVLLSGKSRLAYHGIPCILPGTCPRYITERFPTMAAHRVNLSLRQVFVEEEDP